MTKSNYAHLLRVLAVLFLLSLMAAVIISVLERIAPRDGWVKIPGTSIEFKSVRNIGAEPIVPVYAKEPVRKDAMQLVWRRDNWGNPVSYLRVGPAEYVGFSSSGAICANARSCDLYKVFQVNNSPEGKIEIYKKCCGYGDPKDYELRGQVQFNYNFGPGLPLMAALMLDAKDENLLSDLVEIIRSVKY